MAANTQFKVEQGLLVVSDGANSDFYTNVNVTGLLTVNGNVVANVVNVGSSTTVNGTNISTSTENLTGALTVGNSTVNVFTNNTIFALGNTTANVSANSTTFKAINSTATATLNPTTLTLGGTVVNTTTVNTNIVTVGANVSVGANVVINTSAFSIGNSTVNVTSNSSIISGTGIALTGSANVGTNLTVGNSTANVFASGVLIEVANSSTSANITPIGFTVGSTVANGTTVTAANGVFSTSVAVGNSTANVFANSILVKVSNSTVTTNVTPNGIQIGANTSLFADILSVGNSTVNAVVNSTQIQLSGNLVINSTTFMVGNSSVKTTANSTAVNTNAFNALVSVNVGSNVMLSAGGLHVGNSTTNAAFDATGFTVANSTTMTVVSPMGVLLGNTAVLAAAIDADQGAFNISVNVGSNASLSTSALNIGNSTVNTTANSSQINTGSLIATTVNVGTLNASVAANVGANVNLSTSTLMIGNSTVNTTANSSIITSGRIDLSAAANVGANVNLTTAGFQIGNSTVNTTANSSTVNTGTLNASLVNVGTGVFITNNTIQVGPLGINTVNVLIGNSSISIGNSTLSTTANTTVVNTGTLNTTTGANVGANVSLTTTSLSVGNSTANLLANSIIVQVANSTATANLQPTQLVIGSSTVNSTSVGVGSGIFTVNATIGANVTLSNTGLVIGNSTVNTFANSSVVNTSTFNATTRANVGANVSLTTAQLAIGNSTANLLANSIIVQVANSTSGVNVTPTAINIGANVTLSTSTLTAGLSTVNNTTIAAGNTIGINTASPSVSLTIVANDAILLPVGNTGLRPTGNNGLLRLNSDQFRPEVYTNAWTPVALGAVDSSIRTIAVVEGAANNILQNSANVLGTGWSNLPGGTSSEAASAQADPFGGSSAFTITQSGSDISARFTQQNILIPTDLQAYTFSVYAHNSSVSPNTEILGQIGNNTVTAITSGGLVINSQSGTITTTTGIATDKYGVTPCANGWYRYWFTVNNTNTTADRIALTLYADRNAANGSTIWSMPQIEKVGDVNTYGPTSYIPTSATALKGTGKARPGGALNINVLPLDNATLTDNGSGYLVVSGTFASNTTIVVGNGTINSTVNSTIIAIKESGNSIIANTSSMRLQSANAFGLGTANTYLQMGGIQFNGVDTVSSNTTSGAFAATGGLIYTDGVNHFNLDLYSGPTLRLFTITSNSANVLANSEQVTIGNTTANLTMTRSLFQFTNSTSNSSLSPGVLSLNVASFTTNVLSTVATGAQVIDAFPTATFVGATFSVSVKVSNSTANQAMLMQDLVVVCNSTAANLSSALGQVIVGTAGAVNTAGFTVAISGGNCQLKYNVVNANTNLIKVLRKALIV